MFGTRFLATPEAPLPESFKQVIVDSDGHNTLLTEIPDVATGVVWPGAYARVQRNRFVEGWLGREGELRYQQQEVAAGLTRAFREGDTDAGVLHAGQSAGLVDAVDPAAELVGRIVDEAEAALRAGASRTN